MATYANTADDPVSRFTRLPWVMILLIMALGLFGVAVLYSATITNEVESALPIKHAIRVGMAFVFLIFLAMAPLKLWAGIAYPAYFGALILLFGVEFMGATGGGAQRWLDIGPIRVQPSEFMKLALLLALARYYHSVLAGGERKFIHHIPALIMIAVPTLLVFRQPDLGTALMLAATGFAVMFFAGLNYWIILIGIFASIPTALFGFYYVIQDYQRERVLTAIDPGRDPLGAGYQIQQAEIAIGSGGYSGRGFMQGTQSQLDFIPEQHTDFIFTVIAEEFGFVGSTGMLLAWLVIFTLGFIIAGKSKSRFGYLASAGAIVTVAFYVCVNIGMVSGMLPVVGVPLPLISYGGTAMLTVMAAFALVCATNLDKDRPMVLNGLI